MVNDPTAGPDHPSRAGRADGERSRVLSRRTLLLLAGGGAVGVPAAAYLATRGGDVAGRTARRVPLPRRLIHPFWTTPLPADVPLAATSQDYVARLTAQAGLTSTTSPVAFPYDVPFNVVVLSTDYSLCIYTMPEDWPRTPVWSRRSKEGLQEVLDRGVPVPDPADLPDGEIAPAGTDGATIILQGDELWELWQFAPGGPDGFDWSCEQGGYMRNFGEHPGWWAGSPAFGGGTPPRVLGDDWGVSACGQSYLGGILTAEDFYSAAIEHPLPLALPITGGGLSTPTHVLPATRYDQLNFTYASDDEADRLRLPEGVRYRLPHPFDIEAWVEQRALSEPSAEGSTAEVLRKVLVCLRDYGLFVAESSGVVGFTAEHEKVFGTPYHPFTAEQRPQWGNFGQQIPWSDLVQLEPPEVDVSVPGAGPA